MANLGFQCHPMKSKKKIGYRRKTFELYNYIYRPADFKTPANLISDFWKIHLYSSIERFIYLNRMKSFPILRFYSNPKAYTDLLYL